MADALSIALSGLKAQQQRLSASASNIANVSSGGAVPSTITPSSLSQPKASTVYKPLTVNPTTVLNGDGSGAGVSAPITEDPNGYSIIYNPTSPDANSGGFTAVPNVDFAQEAVNLLEAKTAYKANISVIKTQSELDKELLNVLS